MRLSTKRMNELDRAKRRLRGDVRLWEPGIGDRISSLIGKINAHQAENHWIRHHAAMEPKLRNYMM